MAIKGGDAVIVGRSVVLDRVQTGGPGQLNIPSEKIYEVGDYQSVATVLDTPDLQFTAESFDVRAEAEATCLGRTYGSDSPGQEYDLSLCLPLNALAQIKRGKTATSPDNVAGSIVAPYLTVDSISYRYGIRDNAQQTFSLRGDSLYYSQGSAYEEETTGTNTANQVVSLTHLAYPYADPILGVTRYALGVFLRSGRRLRYGVDYTEAATGVGAAKDVDVTVIAAVAASDKIVVVYSSDTVASYPQNSFPDADATAPAAIKGKNIDVYLDGVTSGDLQTRVQSATVDWKITLDRDEEFGNPEIVSQDYDVPAVTGTIQFKPDNMADFLTRLRTVSGVPTGQVIGPWTRDPISLDIVLKAPEDGSVVKTLYVEDAQFTLPSAQFRANQKTTVDFNFESAGGNLSAFKGERP